MCVCVCAFPTHFILTKQLRKMRQRQRQRTGTRSRLREIPARCHKIQLLPFLPTLSMSIICERSDDLSGHSTYRLAYA